MLEGVRIDVIDEEDVVEEEDKGNKKYEGEEKRAGERERQKRQWFKSLQNSSPEILVKLICHDRKLSKTNNTSDQNCR